MVRRASLFYVFTFKIVAYMLSDQSTGRSEYVMKCIELRVNPSSIVMSNISREDLVLTHAGLRQKGGIALAECLRVRPSCCCRRNHLIWFDAVKPVYSQAVTERQLA